MAPELPRCSQGRNGDGEEGGRCVWRDYGFFYLKGDIIFFETPKQK